MSVRFEEDGSLEFTRGDTIRRRLRLRQPDGTTPLDLTGATFRAQCRSKVGGPIVFEFEVIEQDLLNGAVTLFVSHEITKDIRVTEAVWDLQVTWANGYVETLIGPAVVTIIRDVTTQ